MGKHRAGELPWHERRQRYQDIKNGKLPCHFVISNARLREEQSRRFLFDRRMSITIFKEARKLEAGIGSEEIRLLGRYARLIRSPDKVIEMVEYLAAEEYEKKYGKADPALWIDAEMEILRLYPPRTGKDPILTYTGTLLKKAEKSYPFKKWETRLILGYAYHLGTKEGAEKLVRDAVLNRRILEETACGLAEKEEQFQMGQEGFLEAEGMPGYIFSKEDFGVTKPELGRASFLLHDGRLLRRCMDGTKLYQADRFTVEGSYVLPHFYAPVYGYGKEIEYFEIADKRHRQILAERDGDFSGRAADTVKESREKKSVLAELKSHERGDGGAVPGRQTGNRPAGPYRQEGKGNRMEERNGDKIIQL